MDNFYTFNDSKPQSQAELEAENCRLAQKVERLTAENHALEQERHNFAHAHEIASRLENLLRFLSEKLIAATPGLTEEAVLAMLEDQVDEMSAARRRAATNPAAMLMQMLGFGPGAQAPAGAEEDAAKEEEVKAEAEAL